MKMKSKSLVLRILNVRPVEWKMVRALFVFEFFQGAGIAFFFTAAFALFLANYPITELPKVLIYSSFMLWILGYVYSQLESKLHIITLAKSITIFMAFSFLVFRFAVDNMPTSFLYIMLGWFNVLYLLNNLEFWGITSLLFDVRQGKRLFGLISAGDIPAKFIGYTVALLLVSYIGTANLLWVGLACILVSYPLIYKIEKLGQLKKHDEHHETGHAQHNVSNLVKKISANTLIRRIAIITVIASAAFIIVNFSFYAKVKDALHSDVDLAQFIALFFATVRIVALVVKMIFTGRLINKLGIIQSLLITPVLMILLVLVALIADVYIPVGNYPLYLFGAMSILVDVLRTSINTPVFLILMQPLSTHDRLRAHTITKEIMDPFVSLITGVLLLMVLRFDHDAHLQSLNYILLTLGVLWIIGIYRIHQQYLKTLLKTISNRFFSNTEFSLNDSSTVNWIKSKLSSGTETEAFNILRILTTHPHVFDTDVIMADMDHPSASVKTKVIQMAVERNVAQPVEKLRDCLQSEAPLLKAEAIKHLCRLDMKESEMESFMQDDHPIVQKAAITGIIKFGNTNSAKKAEECLHQLIYSDRASARLRAALILQELTDKVYKNEIVKLIGDPDKEVMEEAFIAAGKTGDEDMLQQVLDHLNGHEKIVIETLFVAGEKSLPLLESFILKKKCTQRQTERLIRLIGRIGGNKAHHVLLNLMDGVVGYPHVIIKTFYHSDYTGSQQQRIFFEEQARKCLSNCASILYMQQLLLPHRIKYKLLYDSLELEMNNLKDSLLYIFALLYDREKIKDVRSAFQSGKKDPRHSFHWR